MATREDVQRLMDAVPDDRLDAVWVALWQLVPEDADVPVVREFETDGVFEGDPDLGARVKDIVRPRIAKSGSATA
jgi:hypothetical protein